MLVVVNLVLERWRDRFGAQLVDLDDDMVKPTLHHLPYMDGDMVKPSLHPLPYRESVRALVKHILHGAQAPIARSAHQPQLSHTRASARAQTQRRVAALVSPRTRHARESFRLESFRLESFRL